VIPKITTQKKSDFRMLVQNVHAQNGCPKELETTVFQVPVDRGLDPIPVAPAELRRKALIIQIGISWAVFHHYESTVARSLIVRGRTQQ
jgi:hypothetical protein